MMDLGLWLSFQYLLCPSPIMFCSDSQTYPSCQSDWWHMNKDGSIKGQSRSLVRWLGKVHPCLLKMNEET